MSGKKDDGAYSVVAHAVQVVRLHGWNDLEVVMMLARAMVQRGGFRVVGRAESADAWEDAARLLERAAKRARELRSVALGACSASYDARQLRVFSQGGES